MSVLRSGSPHRPARSLATVAGILLALVPLLLGLPGTAGAAATQRAPEPRRPEQDWAGSQITRHEGTADGGAPPAAPLASVEGVASRHLARTR